MVNLVSNRLPTPLGAPPQTQLEKNPHGLSVTQSTEKLSTSDATAPSAKKLNSQFKKLHNMSGESIQDLRQDLARRKNYLLEKQKSDINNSHSSTADMRVKRKELRKSSKQFSESSRSEERANSTKLRKLRKSHEKKVESLKANLRANLMCLPQYKTVLFTALKSNDPMGWLDRQISDNRIQGQHMIDEFRTLVKTPNTEHVSAVRLQQAMKKDGNIFEGEAEKKIKKSRSDFESQKTDFRKHRGVFSRTAAYIHRKAQHRQCTSAQKHAKSVDSKASKELSNTNRELKQIARLEQKIQKTLLERRGLGSEE